MNSLLFVFDQVSNKGVFTHFCVAVDATDVLEVKLLIWQPIVVRHNFNKGSVSQQGVLVEVGMAAQTDIVVVGDNVGDFGVFPCMHYISVWIVATPACEFLFKHLMVRTFQVFRFDGLEVILGILFVTPMAVDALADVFKPQIDRVREGMISFGVAVEA